MDFADIRLGFDRLAPLASGALEENSLPDPWRCSPRDLFTRLPRMTVSQLPEFLPDRWRDSRNSD